MPENEPVADVSQGVPLATIEKLAHYRADDYDWRKCEAKINAIPNFITEIDGLDIHFVHARSKHENALPIISRTVLLRSPTEYRLMGFSTK